MAHLNSNAPLVKGIENDTGEIIMQDHRIEHHVRNHYKKLLYDEDIGIIKVKEIEDFQVLHPIFQAEDIHNALDDCNLEKGIGTDLCYGRIFKDRELGSILIDKVLKILNNPKSIPKYLSEGRLVLLSKNDSSFPKVNDTRPIVVEQFITKLMEKTVLTKLKKVNSVLTAKRDYQAGFTDGKSTTQNIAKLLLITTAQKSNTKGNKGFFFVDFKKAFDSCNRQILFQRLWNQTKSTEEKALV